MYNGFDEFGYIFYPHSCIDRKSTKCRVHIHLHGANLSKSIMGSSMLRNAGFFEWAANNNLIILMPQNMYNIPFNSIGAWWTDKNIIDGNALTKEGLMPRVFKAMIDRLLEPRDQNHDYLDYNIADWSPDSYFGLYELYFFFKNFWYHACFIFITMWIAPQLTPS